MNKFKLSVLIVFNIVISQVAAFEISSIFSYSESSKDINVMGYELPLKSGGIGIQISNKYLEDKLEVKASYQQANSVSTEAAFNSNLYTGSADIKTQRIAASYELNSYQNITPFISLGINQYDGDISFTGANTTGTAQMEVEQKNASIGLKYPLYENLMSSIEYGKSKWNLKSVADGTTGRLRTRTTVSADNNEPFYAFNLTSQLSDKWIAKLKHLVYEMTALNSVKTSETSLNIGYEF